jgi:hypothetical protein
MIHIIPTTKTVAAQQTAIFYFDNVFKLHGWPKRLVSDRRPQFVSDLFRSFLALVNTQVNLSTAHHPETDGSTEIANSIIQQCIRVYCSYQQDDWSNLISLAEFTYNNTHHSTINMAPSYF